MELCSQHTAPCDMCTLVQHRAMTRCVANSPGGRIVLSLCLRLYHVQTDGLVATAPEDNTYTHKQRPQKASEVAPSEPAPTQPPAPEKPTVVDAETAKAKRTAIVTGVISIVFGVCRVEVAEPLMTLQSRHRMCFCMACTGCIPGTGELYGSPWWGAAATTT